MTREEEILYKAGSISDGMIAHNVPLSECQYYYDGYIDGAKWADKNPNLSSLWHDASEKPKEGADILFIAKKGKIHKASKIDDWFYDWINENDGIERWAYINDLLPKE